MVSRRSTINRRRVSAKAFTLVEMLIVGALIALFSGLAIFGVQQQFRSNQRKAVIGESRQVASALDFAYNDLGFFPKIGLLQESLVTLKLESQREYGNELLIFDNMQLYNIPTIAQADAIQEDWNGPYFAASQSRSRISQGRGGSRRMLISGADTVGFLWPVDVWNNPYMLYNMNVDRSGGNPTLYFTTATPDDPNTVATDVGKTGNFVNAVVSYGQNQVPGGHENYIASGNLNSAAETGPFGLRLYIGNPNATVTSLELMVGNDLFGAAGRRRANAWSVEFATNNGTDGSLALDTDGNPNGITDTESDDVVFTF